MPTYGSIGVPTACRICAVHAPFETLTIYWLAERQGEPPYMPDPALFDTNAVFLFGGRSAEAPKLLPSLDGHEFTLWGEYHYAIVTPIGLTANFNTGLPAPDTITNIADTTLPSTLWQKGILDSNMTATYVAPGTPVIIDSANPFKPIHNPTGDGNLPDSNKTIGGSP